MVPQLPLCHCRTGRKAQPEAGYTGSQWVLRFADVLAGRKTAGELTGQVLVGGKRPSRMFMRRYTGYVEQFGGPHTTRLFSVKLARMPIHST